MRFRTLATLGCLGFFVAVPSNSALAYKKAIAKPPVAVVGEAIEVERVIEAVPEPAPAPSAPMSDPAKPMTGAGKPMETPPKDKPAPEEAAPAKPAVPLSPKAIRLNLLDGSVISGELSITEITVTTEFGKLTIPVAKLRSITPGLDSYPEVAKKLDDLIERLGSDDYKSREESRLELIKWGGKIREELARFKDSDNPERRRHISQILVEIDKNEGENAGDDEEGASTGMIRKDTIVTSEFTIVGKVSPDVFKVDSKYGPLTVRLADVKMAERGAGVREAIRRTVKVDGETLVQREFKSSGLKVQKGDRVTIVADGQVQMTPWGSNYTSGPDGGAYFGWYVNNEIYAGALVGRIGASGKITKYGSRVSFVAKEAGTLEFAIAMNPSYAGRGYNFPGQYNVKVKLETAE